MSDKVNDSGYYKGSQDTAQVLSEVTRKTLAKRKKLTDKSDRLLIVMVGLPGRGKSFISRKLQSYFRWRGAECEVFNVGKYRREFTAQHRKELRRQSSNDKIFSSSSETGGASAGFFDPSNDEAKKLRENVAMFALNKLFGWMGEKLEEGEERVAIFDATNSTKARRASILNEISTKYYKKYGENLGVVFLESICDDQELLDDNFRQKVKYSPDFAGMTEEEAMRDLKERVQNYEAAYERIEDDSISYIQIFNLSSKLLANQIYGRMSKSIVPALMMWHVGNRPIFLCRAGMTLSEEKLKEELRSLPRIHSNVSITSMGSKRNRGDRLGSKGLLFRKKLSLFMEKEVEKFIMESGEGMLDSIRNFNAGTSQRIDPNLMAYLRDKVLDVNLEEDDSSSSGSSVLPTFPCKVMCSTMPRAIETSELQKDFEFEQELAVDQYSNLNPLDKGDFSGFEIEEICEKDPDWYNELVQDSYRTRFPGGESYKDLVTRLESCVIDMEMQVGISDLKNSVCLR